jgi:uncharacterized protein (DUF885 family)
MTRTIALAAILLAAASPAALAQTSPAPVALSANAEDARLNVFLDAAYDARVALSPQQLTNLGIKRDYGKLDDQTRAADDRALALIRGQVAQMKRDFAPAKLSPEARLSYELFVRAGARAEEAARWRDHQFTFTALGSPTSEIPVFLINNHRVDSVADAEAYVSRLRETRRVMAEVVADYDAKVAKGVIEPKLIFAPSIADARRVITGAPFSAGADTALWADFKAKVGKLDTDAATKARLLADGEAALKGPFRQGYEQVIAALEAASKKARSDDGVWRLPDGDAFYASQLRSFTTTDLTADQVHQIGLSEMARIHVEMETIKAKVGFKGSLQDFFAAIKSGQQFHYPNTDAGREAYLSDARGVIAQVMAKAPAMFWRLPKSPLEVRAVEKWREATAAVAFYNRGAPDGSRPGIMYVNLSDLTQTLKPQVEGIACHEGAPGHHFQNSFAMETQGLPKFRRFGGYGAYGEGWGLYSEGLCKELGLYQDPYSDFGRLSLDAWRAARLVTDTGLHAKHWSRAQAIAYFKDNSLLSDLDIAREVDRYITYPGQATSYKIGQIKIVELRRKAEKALGPKFDVRDFHQAVLSEGGLPLDVLEQQVDAYIASKR